MIPIVAIDGPSGSGKGTIAKLLALDLGWNYLDSGLIYRCYAYLSKNKINNIKEEILFIKHEFDSKHEKILYKDKNITADIRSAEISMLSSEISQQQQVRDDLFKIQKAYLKEPGLVAEGRDMSSRLFPESKVQIFLTASLEERLNRRLNQLRNHGQKVNISKLKDELTLRDQRDSLRKESPLIKTVNSITVDNTNETVEETLDLIKNIINERY
ncbi:MAG: (d)CMP kinase [SAR86 cluster bacterium]|uniref:Cytidylate kinase n=1 Tax=SAR86 cluster bacterium TaxID=2030880 RepID=A0A937ICB7_9GAMM|nr:(d)CMP kinase [SAR86 cluster bacterium]